LARAIDNCLGLEAKTLLKRKEIPQVLDDDTLVTPIAVKLDQMASILQPEPLFSKSGKIKHRLSTISYQNIAAVHVICPSSFKCEDTNCKPMALYQVTAFCDIPKVTLIKRTTIYNKVNVLTGKCNWCNARYHADNKDIIQASEKRSKLYLNSAKYLKIGQNIWVDWIFSNTVVNAMHSFHASAAAFTKYWNNIFGQIDLECSAKLYCPHIWQAFIQESIWTIAANQDIYLELNEDLPNDEVTKGAFAALGQNGIIYAAVAMLVQNVHNYIYNQQIVIQMIWILIVLM